MTRMIEVVRVTGSDKNEKVVQIQLAELRFEWLKLIGSLRSEKIDIERWDLHLHCSMLRFATV
jgi:hypothetical protein